MLGISSCGEKRSSDSKQSKDEATTERPSNPEIETTYGELPGGFTTMDEYYLDDNGNKVWHGRRVTNYPSGMKKMEAFYEHGKEQGYIKYDEVGNVIEDTRQ